MQATNANNKRKQQTQALMGATRLASGKDAAIILQRAYSPPFSIPTRGRGC